MFAANHLKNGKRKHTVLNAEETGWFVCNMATDALRDAINLSAIEWPAEKDEFTRAGVTPVASTDAPCPRAKKGPAHFECKYFSTHRLRGHLNHGWVDVVYGEVERIHVANDLIMCEEKIDISKIGPLVRLGYFDDTSVTDVFEMRSPGASVAAGLEGKSINNT